MTALLQEIGPGSALGNEAGKASSPNLKGRIGQGEGILAEAGAGCIGVHSKDKPALA